MPNIAVVLKEEITRLARKECRVQLAPLLKEKAELKSAISQLKKRVDQLERKNKRLKKTVLAVAPEASSKLETPPARQWVTAKGIRAMRKRMQLSQAEMGQLLGVSAQTIVRWEKEKGRLILRSRSQAAVTKLRGIGVREARKLLEQSASE